MKTPRYYWNIIILFDLLALLSDSRWYHIPYVKSRNVCFVLHMNMLLKDVIVT
jgi:hypothetical protein